MRIFISAGEASGDLYASRLVEAVRKRHPQAQFFACAGPRMQAAAVRAIVDARSLNVVGIVEVIAHLPRIWREFRKLIAFARTEHPDLAVLTDSPDFHLPLANAFTDSESPWSTSSRPKPGRGEWAACARYAGPLSGFSASSPLS